MAYSAPIVLLIYLVFAVVLVRLLATNDLFPWKQSRCHPLGAVRLKTWQLKIILNQRGVDCTTAITNSALVRLVNETGDLTQSELNTASIPSDGDVTSASKFDLVEFPGRTEMMEKVRSSAKSVWLILRGDLWMTRIHSKPSKWLPFLKRVRMHGIQTVLQGCKTKWDCPTDGDSVLMIHGDGKLIYTLQYMGLLNPTHITLWIFETLSKHITRMKSFDEVWTFWEEQTDRSTIIVASNLRHSSPLTFAVLAAEFKGHVQFVWIEDTSLDFSSILVTITSKMFHFDSIWCLQQSELRFLLNMLTFDEHCLIVVSLLFFTVVGILVPVLADTGKRIKSFLWYLLKCVVVLLLFIFLGVYYSDYIESLVKVLRPRQLVLAINRTFLLDFLRLFHLFSEHPEVGLTFVVYVVFVRLCSPQGQGKTAQNQERTTSIKDKLLEVISQRAVRTRQTWTAVKRKQKLSEHGKNSTTGPRNLVENPATDVSKNQTMQAASAQTKQIMAGKSCTNKNGDSSTGNDSSQNSSSKTYFDDNAIGVSTSNKTDSEHSDSELTTLPNPFPEVPVKISSSTSPFQFPPLDCPEGQFTVSMQAQLNRLSIPKFWLQPMISRKRLLELAPSCGRELSYDAPDSQSRDLCFVCGTGFQPKDTLRQLPCSDLLHPNCLDEWVKTEEADCPKCQRPFYFDR